MLKRRIPLLLISLLLLAFITAVITPHATMPIVNAVESVEPQSNSESALDERIKRVENGLLPPFTIKGQSSGQMTLADGMKFYNTFPITTAVEISFVKDEKGQVTHLILRQGGQDIRAKKIN